MTTFPAGEQTHQAVLPQQPALESVGADNPGSRDETAHGHPAAARGTGREHGRGETDGSGTGTRRRHAKNAATAAQAAEEGSIPAPRAPASSSDEKKETREGGTTVVVRRGLISVELHHRGDQIHRSMQQRAGYRHRRRSANCRYRAPRPDNRAQPPEPRPRRQGHRARLLRPDDSGPLRVPAPSATSRQAALRVRHG
ncbi:RRXRR domain-containing protein [Streptomyces spiralis]|uniref:RRXRR domain-containing protein n=1 Tax=Streptomyces spiralis TaxID=66376 RepID=UPI0033D1C316